jgi:hypothetical protein
LSPWTYIPFPHLNVFLWFSTKGENCFLQVDRDHSVERCLDHDVENRSISLEKEHKYIIEKEKERKEDKKCKDHDREEKVPEHDRDRELDHIVRHK